MRCAILFAMFAFALVQGALKDEWCLATIECDDAGLTCTGTKCHCLMEFGEPTARVWACNEAKDCADIAEKAIRHVEEQVKRNARAPVCVPSAVCPPVPGFVGYCDVTMDA